MIELAMELTTKGAILPDAKSLMTVELAQAFIEKRFGILEMAVTERVSAAIHRHDQLNYDLKEYQRVEAQRGRINAEVIARLSRIEKMLRIKPFKLDPEHPGKGTWRLTAQLNAAKQSAQTKATRKALRLPGPDPAWRKEADAAAKKLQAELPPKSNIPDLMRRFGISYSRFTTLIGKKKLTAIREGAYLFITRESIVQYIKENGIPKPRSRRYGQT